MVFERSSFAWMKANNDKFRPTTPVLRKGLPPMIRKGKSGGAGELYSTQQQDAIDAHARAGLERLGCDLPYEELFGR